MHRATDWIVTLALLAGGLGLAGAAVAVSVSSGGVGGSADFPLRDREGKPLFPDFPAATKVAGLTITDYNADLDQSTTFEVAKKGGRWVIPSQGDYPADAEQQLARAATALIELPVLEAVAVGTGADASADVGEAHTTYGVVAPTAEELAKEKSGVGRMITFTNDAGDTLASLIIGNSAEKADPDAPGGPPATGNLRFVRIVGQDPVYVVAIDPALFSAKFETWINRDLLGVNPFDVASMTFANYSVLSGIQQGRLTPRLIPGPAMTVRRNEEAGKWDLASWTSPGAGGVETEEKLKPDQMLDATVLDAARDALKSVTIVDVQKKPEGLQADLTVSETVKPSEETLRSLQLHGFFIAGAGKNQELLAANGEMVAALRSGVEYVLRFGETAEPSADAATTEIRRYMMVTARVDEAKFPAPQPPDETPAEAKPADAAGAKPTETPAKDAAAGDAPADDAAKPADANSADAKPAEGEKATEDAVDAREQQLLREAEQKAERERLQKEYETKLAAWRTSRQKADQEVQRLNARFADWYYVIDEAMYQKLHLTQDAIVKAKPAEPPKPGSATPPGLPPSPELTLDPVPPLPAADEPAVSRFRRMSEMTLPESK